MKELKEFMDLKLVVSVVLAVTACYMLYYYAKLNKELYADFSKPTLKNKEFEFREGNDFFVYNYYKIPIALYVTSQLTPIRGAPIINTKKTDIFIVENVEPGERKGVKIDSVMKYLRDGATISVKSSKGEIIGKCRLTIEPDKTIRALHCGMNTAHQDISIVSEGTHSPLGTALPRLRIVNTSPRTLRLTTTGGNELIIPAEKSLLYMGQYENGIPMGTIFRDIDGILQDYHLELPVTDLFMGMTSDISIPLYRGSYIGGEYQDEPGINYYPLEINPTQLHNGVSIDKTYIPRNW